MEPREINRIIVTGRLYKEMEAALSTIASKEFLFLPEEKLSGKELGWADAYVAFRPAGCFDFYKLKWVHVLGAGVDSFLFDRQWKEDVVLTRTICSFGTKISEYCLSYILADIQKHETFQRQQRMKIWHQVEPVPLTVQNILILGTGVIGQELAKKLSLLGVKIVGVSSSGEQKEYFSKVIKLNDLYSEISSVDWMINTLPLTKDTEGIIGSRIFQHMNNACFINVGRGKSVNEKDMIAAVNSGNLRKVILDVFPMEPVPEDSELWENPNILITPHISAITSVDEAVKCFIETLQKIECGCDSISNRVDIIKGY